MTEALTAAAFHHSAQGVFASLLEALRFAEHKMESTGRDHMIVMGSSRKTIVVVDTLAYESAREELKAILLRGTPRTFLSARPIRKKRKRNANPPSTGMRSVSVSPVEF